DTMCTYSSRGPSRLDFVLKPDLVAPGNRFISAKATNCYLSPQFDNTNLVPFSYYSSIPTNFGSPLYYRLSGTSMAAAVVSGAVALMLHQDPTLSPGDEKARLMQTADKWWNKSLPAYDIYSRGAGMLDVAAALRATGRVAC